MPWSLGLSPWQDGRVAVVTGANSGLGFATAAGLRSRGARVVLACRNVTKADAAAERLVALGPGPAPLVVGLDLEDLDSVHQAVADLATAVDRVDLLINNAGLMGPTGDDHAARQLWANHLGHVALTAGLLPRINQAGGRIVVVSSVMHRRGTLDAGRPLDLAGQAPMSAYGSTKLMNLLFCFEADRRLRAEGARASIRAAHPGNARSELTANGMAAGRPPVVARVVSFLGDRVAQPTAKGAEPTLRAALDPAIPPGSYVGPSGPFELWGHAVPVGASDQALDRALAAALFDASLEAVGATWSLR
jgi:NAD(P)-dependent dehydrogenase (short-subunit alcohol dehydrogenase family)